jgi:hypothetical protein
LHRRPIADRAKPYIGVRNRTRKVGGISHPSVRPFRPTIQVRDRNGGFPRLSSSGTVDAKQLAWPLGSPPVRSGRQTMTFNLGTFQQFAISAIGALFTASLFISAAVGSVGQFI